MFKNGRVKGNGSHAPMREKFHAQRVKTMEGSLCPALRSCQVQREHEESHGDVIRKRRKKRSGRMSQRRFGTR